MMGCYNIRLPDKRSTDHDMNTKVTFAVTKHVKEGRRKGEGDTCCWHTTTMVYHPSECSSTDLCDCCAHRGESRVLP